MVRLHCLLFTFAILPHLLMFSVVHCSNMCGAAPSSQDVKNTSRAMYNSKIKQNQYRHSGQPCMCLKCYNSFIINFCRLAPGTINMIQGMTSNDVSQDMFDALHGRQLLPLINNIKKGTVQYHLFCYNFCRGVFNNAELLHEYVTILEQRRNGKEKCNLQKILCFLRKNCFFIYSDSNMSATFEFYRKSKLLFTKGLRVNLFHSISIRKEVVLAYISRFGGEKKYFDVISLFNLVPRYVLFTNWSEECIQSLSYFCNDLNVVIAITNIFVDVVRIGQYVALEFITWKHLISIEFSKVVFTSDSILLSLRCFTHLVAVHVYESEFLQQRLLCYDKHVQCGTTSSFKKDLHPFRTLSALNLKQTDYLAKN